MAAHVPYEPVPVIAPTERAIPKFQVDAPGAAFGTNIAEAEVGLGQAATHTGDVLFDRALQLQNLTNDTNARQGFIDAETKIGERMSKYNQLEGQNAVDGRQSAIDDVSSIRLAAIKNAKNLMERKLLDDILSKRVAYTITDINTRSSAQAKAAHDKSLDSTIELNQTGSGSDENPASFATRIASLATDMAAKGKDKGWEQSTIDNETMKVQDNAWKEHIRNLAWKNAFNADTIFKANKDQIKNDSVRDEIEGIIRQAMLTNGAPQDASSIRSGLAPKHANFAKPDEIWGNPGTPGHPNPTFEKEHLTDVTVQGRTTKVNKLAAKDIQEFLDELDSRGYKFKALGGYSLRDKINRKGDLSQHAFGNAIDINEDQNEYGQSGNDLPPDIREIAARHHMHWGGDWSGTKDPMHFEWGGLNDPITGQSPTSVQRNSLDQASVVAEKRIPQKINSQTGEDENAGYREQYRESIVRHLNSGFSTDRKMQRADTEDKQRSVEQEMKDKGVTDPSKLSAPTYQVYQGMDVKQQMQIRDLMQKYEKSKGVQWSQENDDRYHEIHGMMQRDSTRAEALAIDLSKEELTHEQMNKILDERAKWQGRMETTMDRGLSSDVSNALVRNKLNAVGGISNSTTDPAASRRYSRWLGIFEQMRKEKVAEVGGRKLTDDELGKIVDQSLSQKEGTLFGWGPRAYENYSKDPIKLSETDPDGDYRKLGIGQRYYGKDGILRRRDPMPGEKVKSD